MQKVLNVRKKLQVEKLRDEGVQLKMLQTGLALMQCPLLADNEVRSLELMRTAGQCGNAMHVEVRDWVRQQYGVNIRISQFHNPCRMQWPLSWASASGCLWSPRILTVW